MMDFEIDEIDEEELANALAKRKPGYYSPIPEVIKKAIFRDYMTRDGKQTRKDIANKYNVDLKSVWAIVHQFGCPPEKMMKHGKGRHSLGRKILMKNGILQFPKDKK